MLRAFLRNISNKLKSELKVSKSRNNEDSNKQESVERLKQQVKELQTEIRNVRQKYVDEVKQSEEKAKKSEDEIKDLKELLELGCGREITLWPPKVRKEVAKKAIYVRKNFASIRPTEIPIIGQIH